MAPRTPAADDPSAPDPLRPSSPHDPADTLPAGHSLARSAGLIGTATMTSRVLGVVREQVLAYLFGASNAMDAFNVAFRIPNLVRDLFAEGAMSSAFVPIFTRTLTRDGRDAAWRLGSYVLNALVLATTLLVVLGIVFATPLVGAFAAEYADVPGKLELTVSLAQLMLPFLALVAIAAALMGMLNSLHHFFIPALSPAMFNIATIVCTIALVPVMPALGFPAITAVAIGTLAGGVGQVLLQWPALHRAGFRYRPVLDPADDGLRRVLVLMGPGTIGLAATQVNVFVNTVLATGQGTGAVSWLNYAFRLMYLPIGLFGVSIATAAIPSISRLAARDDRPGMRRTVADGITFMLMLNVPATLGLVALASPIVALLFERGHFTAADTAATAAALQLYAIGLVGYSIVKIASPTFYALHDSRTPVAVSVAVVLLNAGLNWVLAALIGYRGLALGTSIAAIVNGGLLLWLLRRRLGGIEGARLATSLAKITAAAIVMGLATWGAERTLRAAVPGMHVAGQILRLAGAMAVAFATLAASAHLLRIAEFGEALATVTARWRARRG